MGTVDLFLLAAGLSMDAFAVSICYGLTMRRATLQKMLVPGLYFGVFQFLMPLIGYLAATLFAEYIVAYDHWIACVLLVFLGGKMIAGSLNQDTSASPEPAKMLPAALATSIDALAVGASLALLPDVHIVSAATFIGVTTLTFSMVGVKIGSVFGSRFKSKAELLGGLILIGIGLKILLEHLGIFVL